MERRGGGRQKTEQGSSVRVSAQGQSHCSGSASCQPGWRKISGLISTPETCRVVSCCVTCLRLSVVIGQVPCSGDFSGYQCETSKCDPPSCPPHPRCGPAVPLWAENSNQHPLCIPPLATVTDTCQSLVPGLFKKDERALCGAALSDDEKKGPA